MWAIGSVSTDITESKRNIEMKEKLAMQDILFKSKILYDELTKNMPNMFFSFDRTFRYTSINKACEKFTGLVATRAIGKTIDEAPGYVPLFLPEYREVLDTGIAKNFISEFAFGRNMFTYSVNIYPTEKGISILMTDLTTQKNSDKKALELVDSLQNKNKDLRQFAYIISHNLRAPIAKLLGLVELFKADPELIINNMSLHECLTNEANNLDNVVKDLNSVISAHDTGKEILAYSTFESKLKLIEQVLGKEITESHADITSDFQNPVGITSINGYVYSIMYNLLSNAIKYRSPKVPLKIHLQSRQDDKNITLTIEDNGMGIDLEKNGDQIFGLYKRFHGNKLPGRGIGLSLVKSQAEALGGTVTVESKVNSGTTFKVLIPKNNS